MRTFDKNNSTAAGSCITKKREIEKVNKKAIENVKYERLRAFCSGSLILSKKLYHSWNFCRFGRFWACEKTPTAPFCWVPINSPRTVRRTLNLSPTAKNLRQTLAYVFRLLPTWAAIYRKSSLPLRIYRVSTLGVRKYRDHPRRGRSTCGRPDPRSSAGLAESYCNRVPSRYCSQPIFV